MATKYQVFVSSTFEDLKEERRILMEQILNLGHIPVGMELFQASNEEQWTYIQRRILECDYYLLVVAERYGSVDGDGKSYTQKEYEFAVANRIPVAAFLLESAARGMRRADFVQHERRAEIDSFRALCSKSKMVKFWDGPADLALKATNALLGLIVEEPRQGWVRADASADAALRELAKLAEEKRELQARLDQIASSSTMVVPAEVHYHLEKLEFGSVANFVPEGSALESFAPLKLLEIFLKVSRHLAIPSRRSAITNEIYRICSMKTSNGVPALQVTDAIFAEFVAMGLVVGNSITGSKGVETRYQLSEYGRKVLMHAERAQEDEWNSEVESQDEDGTRLN